MALLKFTRKIAKRLLFKCKPIGRPAGWPPKKKSLEDVTDGNEMRVVTPNPSNCARNDETGHRLVLRDKKSKCRFYK